MMLLSGCASDLKNTGGGGEYNRMKTQLHKNSYSTFSSGWLTGAVGLSFFWKKTGSNQFQYSYTGNERKYLKWDIWEVILRWHHLEATFLSTAVWKPRWRKKWCLEETYKTVSQCSHLTIALNLNPASHGYIYSLCTCSNFWLLLREIHFQKSQNCRFYVTSELRSLFLPCLRLNGRIQTSTVWQRMLCWTAN